MTRRDESSSAPVDVVIASSTCIVVMGASGSGKSTIGALLAEQLDVPFIEADDYHSDDNRAKMASGVPLSDNDRGPWLANVAAAMARNQGYVCACSALKRTYREILRGGRVDVTFVELHGSRDELHARLVARTEHFMSSSLVDDQISVLQPLENDERGFRVPITASILETVQLIVTELTQIANA